MADKLKPDGIRAISRATRRSAPANDLLPLVASLRGILKNADPEAYRKHLLRKYQ
jgi:hypothetical protein